MPFGLHAYFDEDFKYVTFMREPIERIKSAQMSKIKDLVTFLESVAPSSLQEPYDNSGLIVGNPETEIQKRR